MIAILPLISTLPIAYTAYHERKYTEFLIGLIIFTVIAIAYILLSKPSVEKGLGEFLVTFLIVGAGWTMATFYSWYYTAKHLGKKQ